MIPLITFGTKGSTQIPTEMYHGVCTAPNDFVICNIFSNHHSVGLNVASNQVCNAIETPNLSLSPLLSSIKLLVLTNMIKFRSYTTKTPLPSISEYITFQISMRKHHKSDSTTCR
ncbi:hypothetical protein E2542_SST29546 [Spatholobus suberectus]|nr:hypothetical protein E2542_SST29546 [Spatholobus suberectus]